MTKGRESGAAFENYIAPWQISVIAATFGFKNRETGFRRYKQLNVFVARKNGKSFLGSAIGAYIYAFEKEGGCEVYSVATNAKQAEIVFNTAKTMLMRLTRQSKKLNASLDIRSKEIKKHDDPEASMRYLPSEASRLDGLNPVAVVIDECHELNSEIYEVIISGMGARDEPLLIMTSTAGFRVGGWYHETVKMHKKIVDGVLRQDDVLAYLFTIDVDDGTDPDPKDEAKWIWANPSMVHAGTPKPSYMQERLTQAKNARSFPPFMTKNLNVFITGGNTWMSSADWKQCHDEDLDKSTLIGERCFLGLDLSLNRDLTCLSYYFPDRDVLLVESFLPYESIIMWETKINAPYHQFSEDGWLEATAYPKTDFDLIRRRIEQAHDLYKVGCVAYDRWKASQLVEGLKAAGMTVEAIAMDAKTMSPLIDRFEQKVVTKELRHDGNPLMEWCLAQAQVKV
ncbi:MAG: terminase large subunit, partial [Flavobacteriales bacterium]|nr:terminase large subunit [Flavobacteriales bacterium]